MKKNAKEVYNQIVTAEIGELINTKYKGMNYEYTITDALQQQGYKKGIDFETVFNNNNYQVYIKKLSNIKEYQEPQHNIKKGDIFYHSWGYEQTNIDYYQVIKTTKKTISLIRIKGSAEEYNNSGMTGSVIPIKDNFVDDETIRKTPYLLDGKWCISFEYGAGSQWDGEPMNFTNYA